MTLPVPRSEANVERPRIELDEEESSGDELGRPPSFEIVDEQPMSAQRPRTAEPKSKKRKQEEIPDSEPEGETSVHDPSRMLSLVQELQHMLAQPEMPSPPPRMPVTDTTSRQPAVVVGSVPAKHSLPPVVDPACRRRDVSPYVPTSKGPVPMVTYQPSAKAGHSKPRYYPGTLIAVTPKNMSASSAAVGHPPREPAVSTRPSHEHRCKSKSRKGSRRREKPRERSRHRGRSPRSRSASSRNRLSPTPPRASRSRCKH